MRELLLADGVKDASKEVLITRRASVLASLLLGVVEVEAAEEASDATRGFCIVLTGGLSSESRMG